MRHVTHAYVPSDNQWSYLQGLQGAVLGSYSQSNPTAVLRGFGQYGKNKNALTKPKQNRVNHQMYQDDSKCKNMYRQKCKTLQDQMHGTTCRNPLAARLIIKKCVCVRFLALKLVANVAKLW